ncbi:hypothetical protein [Streptomyces sp. NPDC056188]|uniref:hypothetical protein n=1 Tax=Streptomyces sp. NPDC056188 TaxID=3345740 RepID=UPI0035D5B214
MTAARRRDRLARTRRQVDAPTPTVPGQLTAADVDKPAAVQLPIFAVAGGAYWKAWRTA